MHNSTYEEHRHAGYIIRTTDQQNLQETLKCHMRTIFAHMQEQVKLIKERRKNQLINWWN